MRRVSLAHGVQSSLKTARAERCVYSGSVLLPNLRFLSSQWFRKRRQREKFASGPAFLAVLLRLMTTLVPWLGELKTVDPWLPSRFCGFVATIVEYSKIHPAILFEGSVFFERLSAHRDLLAKDTCCIITTDNAAAAAMPLFLSVLQPPRPKVVADNEIHFNGCHGSIAAQRAAVLSLKSISSSTGSENDAFTLGVGKALFAFLHDRCGRRTFQHFSEFRSLGRCLM